MYLSPTISLITNRTRQLPSINDSRTGSVGVGLAPLPFFWSKTARNWTCSIFLPSQLNLPNPNNSGPQDLPTIVSLKYSRTSPTLLQNDTHTPFLRINLASLPLLPPQMAIISVININTSQLSRGVTGGLSTLLSHRRPIDRSRPPPCSATYSGPPFEPSICLSFCPCFALRSASQRAPVVSPCYHVPIFRSCSSTTACQNSQPIGYLNAALGCFSDIVRSCFPEYDRRAILQSPLLAPTATPSVPPRSASQRAPVVSPCYHVPIFRSCSSTTACQNSQPIGYLNAALGCFSDIVRSCFPEYDRRTRLGLQFLLPLWYLHYYFTRYFWPLPLPCSQVSPCVQPRPHHFSSLPQTHSRLATFRAASDGVVLFDTAIIQFMSLSRPEVFLLPPLVSVFSNLISLMRVH